jgi:hypothetical protein
MNNHLYNDDWMYMEMEMNKQIRMMIIILITIKSRLRESNRMKGLLVNCV